MAIKVKWVGRTPQACSESDSFLPNIYEDFLPLAVLCKISLVLPIRDVFKGMNNLNFNWYSFEVISVLLLSFCISYILPALILYEDNYQPSLVTEALIYSVSNMWFIFGQQLLINLLEKIDRFDHSLNFYSKTSYPKKINKYIWVVMVCIYPIALLSRASLALYKHDPCTEHKCALIEIVRGFVCYQHNLQMAIFMFFCYEIKMRFKTLNDVFCGFLKKTYQCNPVLVENYPQIEAHRLHYARLIQCTKILNQLFGWRFAFMFAAIILFIVSLLYYFHIEEGFIISGYDVMAIVFSFFLLCSLTHNTDLLIIELANTDVVSLKTYKAFILLLTYQTYFLHIIGFIYTKSRQMERLLYDISTQDLNWASMFQLDHALHQCEMFEVHISAREMVTVDKSLLLSMVGAISVYYIAILQMTTTRGSFSW